MGDGAGLVRSSSPISVVDLVAGHGKVEVPHGLSFNVRKAMLATLIGCNGAGKTATPRAFSGTIRLDGPEISGLAAHGIARAGLAHSPEGRRVFPTQTVTDNLMLGAFARLVGARPRRDVLADIARMFELFSRLAERRGLLAGTLLGAAHG